MRSLSILIVIASLALVLVATLALGSLAVFTDQATVAGNTFTTGAFPTATPTPAPISLGAVADTYVKEDKGGDDNFGTAAEIVVNSDPTKRKRGLVSFDVSSIPSGSTINSATLTLCLSANPGSTRTHELRRITSSWVETVVVWNDQPTASGTVTDTITVPTTAQCLTFTVTADVQAWVDGTANNGWRISDQDEATNSGDVEYRTRENGTAAERPKLDVNYQSCSDTTAPGAPNGLVATAGQDITLDWNDNGESDLAGYNVHRSTAAGGPYTKVNSSLLTSSAYTDSGVTGGITYHYVATAVDDCANESANSSEDSARAHSVLNLQSNDTEMSTATSPTGNIDTSTGATDYFTASSPVTWASNETDWSVVLVLRDKPAVAAPATINVWWQNGGACSDGTVSGQIFATGSVTVPIAVDGLGTTLTVPKTGGTVDHTFGGGDELCLSISPDGSGGTEDLHYYANVASTSGTSGVSRLRGPFN